MWEHAVYICRPKKGLLAANPATLLAAHLPRAEPALQVQQMPWKGSDTGLFLRCRHVAWLKRTLNILGQGQGRWRTWTTGAGHDWPVSQSAPDRPYCMLCPHSCRRRSGPLASCLGPLRIMPLHNREGWTDPSQRPVGLLPLAQPRLGLTCLSLQLQLLCA